MLSTLDKDYIIEELIKWVAPMEFPRQTLCAPFINTSFPNDLRQGTPAELVSDAVRLCMNDSWNHDPIWLQLLLDVFSLIENDSKIADIFERASHKPPEAADPLSFTILNNSIPFVNRRSLRQQLRRLEDQAGIQQPILVVNGDERSGKSYSKKYIEHYSFVKNSIITYPISIDKGKEMEMGPSKIARDLVRMMGVADNDPPPDTNLKSYAEDLALWVLNKAAVIPNQHWFILDNFGLQGVREDSRDLLIALSDTVTKGIFPRKCRIIITGFDRALLSVDPGKIDEEIISACTKDDIAESIKEILNRVPIQLSDAGLKQVTDFILLNLPAGIDKMSVLNERLRLLLRAINGLNILVAGVDEVDYEEMLLNMLTGLPAGNAGMIELDKRLKFLRDSKNDN